MQRISSFSVIPVSSYTA